MTTEIFFFYLQNRVIQTSQTGGQWYSDTFPLSIPWSGVRVKPVPVTLGERESGKKMYIGGGS